MPTIKLLHLSDLHIALNPRYLGNYLPVKCNVSCTEEIARISSGFAKFDKIDAVIITGDIANTGYEEDLKYAYGYIEGNPLINLRHKSYLNCEHKPVFKTYGKPVMILPGNHDRFKGVTRSPGAKAFDDIFQDYWKPVSRNVSVHYLPNRKNAVLAIVCADFSLKSKWDTHPFPPPYYLGQGKVYKRRLRVLEKITEQLRKDGIATLWAFHYAPYIEKHSKEWIIRIRGLSLRHSHRIMKTAETLDVRFILCGHAHERHVYYEGAHKNIQIQCASTSTCKNGKNNPEIYYSVFSIHQGKIVEIKTKPFTWNGETFK